MSSLFLSELLIYWFLSDFCLLCRSWCKRTLSEKQSWSLTLSRSNWLPPGDGGQSPHCGISRPTASKHPVTGRAFRRSWTHYKAAVFLLLWELAAKNYLVFFLQSQELVPPPLLLKKTSSSDPGVQRSSGGEPGPEASPTRLCGSQSFYRLISGIFCPAAPIRVQLVPLLLLNFLIWGIR